MKIKIYLLTKINKMGNNIKSFNTKNIDKYIKRIRKGIKESYKEERKLYKESKKSRKAYEQYNDKYKPLIYIL